jgi:hypothetical protein
MLAMGFSSVLSRSIFTSQGVDSSRNGLYVGWINTMFDAAKMISLNFVRWNYFNKELVRNTMSVVTSTVIPKVGIAVAVSSNPQPTWRAIKSYVRVYANLFKEASEKFAVNWKSVRIVVGHRDLLKVNDGLGDVRLQPCAAFSL